jgi:hypothetical protein
VSDFIKEQLVGLVNIARKLNGDLDETLTGRPEWRAAAEQARAQGIAVVEAALGAPYPTIPRGAVDAFDTLAAGHPVEYTVRRINLRGPWVLNIDHRTRISLVGQSAWGIMAAWLAFYFMNPQRDRLRRCQQCSRWFVDMTRNKSALRCSRACTIAWSNAQRDKKGAGR